MEDNLKVLAALGHVGAAMRETVTKATEGTPAHSRAVTGDELREWAARPIPVPTP